MHARAYYTQLILKKIKTFPRFYPRYRYENEGEVNPAYTVLGEGIARPIPPDHPMIWCLRGDGILTMGIKNAYEEPSCKPMTEYFDSSLTHYLKDNTSRFGHPTLAMKEGLYDGSVYYAGWLCQRENYIQVYLSSGRFANNALNHREKYILQTYVAMQFMDTFGEQDVIFQEPRDDGQSYDELVFQFMKNKPVQDPGIRYTPEDISKALPKPPRVNKASLAVATTSTLLNGTGFISSLIVSGGSHTVFATICTAIPVWGWTLLLGASLIAVGYCLYQYRNQKKMTSALLTEDTSKRGFSFALFNRKPKEKYSAPEQEMQPLTTQNRKI